MVGAALFHQEAGAQAAAGGQRPSAAQPGRAGEALNTEENPENLENPPILTPYLCPAAGGARRPVPHRPVHPRGRSHEAAGLPEAKAAVVLPQ